MNAMLRNAKLKLTKKHNNLICKVKKRKANKCHAKKCKAEKSWAKERGSTSGHLPWCLGTSERTMAQTTVDTTRKKTRRWGAWTAERPKPCVSLPGSRSGWGEVGG